MTPGRVRDDTAWLLCYLASELYAAIKTQVMLSTLFLFKSVDDNKSNKKLMITNQIR